MRIKVRIVLVMLLCLAIVAALAPVASAQPSEVVLTIWTRYSQDLVQPGIDAYNARLKAAGKNIRVEHTSVKSDEFVARFTEAVKAGKAPDLVAFDLVDGPRYTAMGALLDLTDRFNSLAQKDTLNKAMLRLGVRQGRVYALPAVADVSVLFYNRKLFKAAGLDPDKPPTTWDELLSDARKLTKDGVVGYELWCGYAGWTMFTVMPYAWANGGKFLSEDGTKAMLDDPKTVEAVQFFADMANKYKVTAPAGKPEGCADNGNRSDPIGFDKGTVAMAPRSSTKLGMYLRDIPSPELKVAAADLGVTLFPGKVPGTHSAFIGGDLIAISTSSKHTDDAWNLVQYWLSADVQNDRLAEQAGFVPVRSDLLDNPVYNGDARYKVLAQALAEGYVPFTPVYNSLYAPFQDGIQSALNGKMPVADALKGATAEMQKVIDGR